MRKTVLNYPERTKTSLTTNTNIVFIALGSNISERILFLREAVKKISQIVVDGTKIIASSVYETKPFGNINQSDFLNAVIKIKTPYSLVELFKFLKQVEEDLGRIEGERWGPREIDLDILFFNDDIFESEELKVPHLGITQRDFVLFPLKDIAKNYRHPVLKKKISDICNGLISNNIIRKTNLRII